METHSKINLFKMIIVFILKRLEVFDEEKERLKVQMKSASIKTPFRKKKVKFIATEYSSGHMAAVLLLLKNLKKYSRRAQVNNKQRRTKIFNEEMKKKQTFLADIAEVNEKLKSRGLLAKNE